jgi:hypothetical protein
MFLGIRMVFASSKVPDRYFRTYGTGYVWSMNRELTWLRRQSQRLE